MLLENLRYRLHRKLTFVLALLVLGILPSCKRGAVVQHEYMYVSAPETSLRDRIATLYNKVGTIHNGDRVEVLERERRFVRVRTASGQEGWVEQRSLIPQAVYDQFTALARDNANAPVEAHGTARSELNIHLTPSREGEHLFQLKEGEKIEILKRTTSEKNPPKVSPAAKSAAGAATTALPEAPGQNGQKNAAQGETSSPLKPTATTPASASSTQAPAKAGKAAAATKAAIGKNGKPEEPKPPAMEDWYLIRTVDGHVGWVLLRMIDLDIPLEVAQYAEGQRIMGYQALNTVQDGDKQVTQYLVLLNEPKDGLPWDYNQIRVFTWNRARHRYETAYRERNLEGYFPVSTGHQVFDKEGDLPTFTIHKKNEDGQMVAVTYKMNGPIVRRVPTPEELAAEQAKHEAAEAARKQYAAQHPQKASSHGKKKKKH